MEPVEAVGLRVNPEVNPRAVDLREEHLRAMEVADRPRDMAAVEELADHHRVMVEVARLVDHHRVTVAAWVLAVAWVRAAAWVLVAVWVLVAGRGERRFLESCPRQSTSLFGFMTLRPSPIGFTDTESGC